MSEKTVREFEGVLSISPEHDHYRLEDIEKENWSTFKKVFTDSLPYPKLSEYQKTVLRNSQTKLKNPPDWQQYAGSDQYKRAELDKLFPAETDIIENKYVVVASGNIYEDELVTIRAENEVLKEKIKKLEWELTDLKDEFDLQQSLSIHQEEKLKEHYERPPVPAWKESYEEWSAGTDPELICQCGHPYYRHFDSYEHNAAVGCKYCKSCDHFQPKNPVPENENWKIENAPGMNRPYTTQEAFDRGLTASDEWKPYKPKGEDAPLIDRIAKHLGNWAHTVPPIEKYYLNEALARLKELEAKVFAAEAWATEALHETERFRVDNVIILDRAHDAETESRRHRNTFRQILREDLSARVREIAEKALGKFDA